MSETILRQNVIVQFEADRKKFDSEVDQAEKKIKRFGINVGTALKAVGGLIAVSAVTGALRSASEAAEDLSVSLGELKAITGASATDIQFYEEAARALGPASGKSAAETVRAFTLIGSARPELLKSKEALVAVTESAITLSQASGLDVPAAADALTTAMNQFQIPAQESARVINVLAAGAKEGAAAIPLQADALTQFGAVASTTNVTLEESVALVEALADRQLRGSRAGNQLKNVLLILSSVKALPPDAIKGLESYGVNLDLISDKATPVTERLRELSKIQNDTTLITKVFGRESAVAGTILLQNVDRINQLAGAVTGTNEAFRQAEDATNNIREAKARLRETLTDLSVGIGTLINQALLPLIKGLTALAGGLRDIPEFLRENRREILGLLAALALFNAGTIAAATNSLALAAAERGRLIITRAVTLATRASAAAMALLNGAMTATPIGFLLKGLGLIVAAMTLLYDRSLVVRQIWAGLAAAGEELAQVFSEVFGRFVEGFRLLQSGEIREGMAEIGRAILRSNPLSLAREAGARAGSAFRDGFKAKAVAEAADKAIAARLKELGIEAGKAAADGVAEGLNQDPDPEDPQPDVGPDRGSIADLQKRIQDAVKAYEELNTETARGRARAKNLAREIQSLTIDLKRLQAEQERLLTRNFDPVALIGAGNIGRVREELRKLNEEIREALRDGTVEQIDELIARRVALEQEILRLAQVWENGDLVTDAIDSLNARMLEALRAGNEELVLELLNTRQRLEAQMQAIKVLAGDEEALDEFRKLGEEALRARQEAERGILEAQKDISIQLGNEYEDRREKEKQAKEKQQEDDKQAAAQSLQALGDELGGLVDAILAARREAYDQAVELQSERVGRFRELAETGSAEQLRIEQDRLNKLEAARTESVQRERNLSQAQVAASQAVTIAKTTQAISSAFAAGGPLGIITGTALAAALGLSIASAIASLDGVFSSIPAFRHGVDFLDGPGSTTSDSILIRASKGERIVDAETNSRLAGIPNARLPEAVRAWREAPAIIGAIHGQTMTQEKALRELISETRWMRREIASSAGSSPDLSGILRTLIRQEKYLP